MSRIELHDGVGGFQPPAGAEVLSIGPSGPPRQRSRSLVAVLVVAVLAVGALFAWQQLRPPPNLTLAQVQQAYGGLVRPDGTNAVTTIDPSKFSPRPRWTTPEECAPLFASTVASRFPAPALDGVSTHRLDRRGSISLFTVRYADADAAEAAFAAVSDASTGCAGQTVTFSGSEGAGRVETVPVTAPADAPEQVAFALDRGRGQGRYALHVLRLSNTVTWQYRYDTGTGPYDPTPAQQLMDGTSSQLLSVQRAAAAGR